MTHESLYARMGGSTALHRLVSSFYDLIENDPRFENLHLLHIRGHGVTHSRAEQINFLSGFLGGPQLYIEKHGHSNVRDMHRHVQIGPIERDTWLSCMALALQSAGIDQDVSSRLMEHFQVVAMLLETENRTNISSFGAGLE